MCLGKISLTTCNFQSEIWIFYIVMKMIIRNFYYDKIDSLPGNSTLVWMPAASLYWYCAMQYVTTFGIQDMLVTYFICGLIHSLHFWN